MDFLSTKDPLRRDSGSKKHWAEFRPSWYADMVEAWSIAWTHYEADFRKLRTSKYLIKRVQGESQEQFDERLLTSDYLPLFGTAVDSLVGRLMAAEPIHREFSREGEKTSLGKIDADDTPAYSIWRDVDGRGTNYLMMLEDLAIRVTVFNEMWVYVRGPWKDKKSGVEHQATVTLIEPAAIVNLLEDENGNPIDVLVKGSREGRTTIEDPYGTQDVYWRFTLDWTQEIVVSKDENGQPVYTDGPKVPYGDSGFSFYKSKRKQQKILPIFKVQLPLRRMVGYILAEKNGVLYNQESERDNILRIACTPMFVFVGSDAQFDKAGEDRKKGNNALQLDPQAARQHYFAAPPEGPADLRTKVLRDKIADFFVSAFRFYEDSIRGKQKTATEVGQDASSGEGSFLNTLAATMDEAEAGIMLRLEQAYYPSNVNAWGQFHVERPRKFDSISPREEADKLADMIFGKYPIPVGKTGRVNAIKQIAQGRRFQIDINEVEAEIEERMARELAEKAAADAAAPPADAQGSPTDSVDPGDPETDVAPE